MDHYLDIRLRPDPDFASIDLLSALVSKLHRALANRAKGDIGVSFPGYRGRYLGDHLRLHGSAGALQAFVGMQWLAGMRDHVEMGEPLPVPSGARHRIVRRVQAKSSPERLRRRRMKRHGISQDQAQALIPDAAAESLALPYVQLRSGSSGQRFPLFIDHRPPQASPQGGTFSSYGLSDTATVPWF